jgi:NAD(P)-dependent dehydrogenase (short-subunit alcohol dehydrogenase family)
MNNKTIFITGGNTGIGLATALLFAKEGANVAILSRRREENAAAREKIEKLGVKALDFAGDVTDEATIRNALAKTAETFGGLHFAFNNAGVEQVPTPLVEQTLEDYRRIIDVNVMGVWLCLKHELPLIEKSGGGCAVNNSSVAGLVGMAQIELYIASKARRSGTDEIRRARIRQVGRARERRLPRRCSHRDVRTLCQQRP